MFSLPVMSGSATPWAAAWQAYPYPSPKVCQQLIWSFANRGNTKIIQQRRNPPNEHHSWERNWISQIGGNQSSPCAHFRFSNKLLPSYCCFPDNYAIITCVKLCFSVSFQYLSCPLCVKSDLNNYANILFRFFPQLQIAF